MFALILSLLCSPPCDAPPPDALRFGVSREVIAANIAAIRQHQHKIVNEIFDAGAVFTWDSRQDNVRRMWEALDKALDPCADNECRVRSLNKLRWLIGDEAYFAGKLPPPIPDYGAWLPLKGE